MTDDTNDETADLESTDVTQNVEPTSHDSSTWKVLGAIDASTGAGVLGHNTATNGTAVGVEGATDSPDGYGLYTADDARVESTMEAPVVQSTSGTALTVNTDGGSRALELGVPTSDGTYTAGGNVVAGHPNNSVNNDAVGVVIGGGGNNYFPNSVGGDYATVAGGRTNEASGVATTVAGGIRNIASGLAATVAGGNSNVASGQYSFAAGRSAKTQTSGGTAHDGAFVWGDSTSNSARSDASDQVVFQAGGGMKVYTNSDLSTNTGAELPAGSGSWSSLSTKTAKENVSSVDPTSTLERFESLEISRWEYETQDGAEHMGPMAEEFYDAFELGADERRISTVDADGVALAAIQGLSEKLDEKAERIEELEAEADRKGGRIEDLEAENEQLRERLATVEDHLSLPSKREQALPADD